MCLLLKRKLLNFDKLFVKKKKSNPLAVNDILVNYLYSKILFNRKIPKMKLLTCLEIGAFEQLVSIIKSCLSIIIDVLEKEVGVTFFIFSLFLCNFKTLKKKKKCNLTKPCS